MAFVSNIKKHLTNQGIDFIRFVDISHLPNEQNKSFSVAILFGIALSSQYIQHVLDTPNYVEKMKQSGQIENDEFHLTELKTDRIADELANYLTKKGLAAYSQSEANIEVTGYYDKQNHVTPLPHKTIALLADLGWIGKHNLLVTKEYGSAISICSVLVDASFETVLCKPAESNCGTCNICVEICPSNALSGNNWTIKNTRENIINVHKCTTCYQCVVHCPWTQKYIHHEI